MSSCVGTAGAAGAVVAWMYRTVTIINATTATTAIVVVAFPMMFINSISFLRIVGENVP
jgi:hypothetical protein